MSIVLSVPFSWMFDAIKKKKFKNISKITLEFKLTLSFADETSPVVPTFLKTIYKEI